MLVFILIFLFYVLLLFLLSLIFSINLCSVAFSSISNNFECGFYSIIISLLRYRFNYWLILFHFLIFEQELILALLLVYGIQTLNSNWIVIILYFILFIDLLFFILLVIIYYLFYYLFIIILRFNKYKINIILLLIIIKGYILYWIISINFIISFIFINLWSNLNLYITMLINNKYYPLSWFMVTVVILISSIVIFNSIDYLSIMDSYPFIFYIILFQLSMINFILSYNIIIAFFLLRFIRIN